MTMSETTAVNWLKARLAEMDAAIEVIEANSCEMDDTMRRQAREYLDGAIAARTQFAGAAQAAIDRNRDFLPGLRNELEPVWDGFEQAIRRWSEISSAQEQIIGAQLKAQTAVWDQLFEEYRIAITDPLLDRLSATVDQIDKSARQVTEFQMKVAMSGSAPWDRLSSALADSRRAAEDAAMKIQETFMKSKF